MEIRIWIGRSRFIEHIQREENAARLVKAWWLAAETARSAPAVSIKPNSWPCMEASVACCRTLPRFGPLDFVGGVGSLPPRAAELTTVESGVEIERE